MYKKIADIVVNQRVVTLITFCNLKGKCHAICHYSNNFPLWVIPKESSRLKIALRNAANAIGNQKEGHLSDFFRRINYKKGRPTAINATARKLAIIIWNMLVKGQNYNPPTQYMFLDEKRRLGLVKRLRKQITKFEIQPEQLGFITT